MEAANPDPTDPTESPSERAFDYYRTVALSDGVFAIALTLLVLTISFPELHNAARHRLGHELASRAPQLYSYALSFAVLAFLWVRHHAFFRGLRRIDGGILGLNLVYLALIAFLPYPTRLLGEFGEQPVAVVSYAGTIVLISLIANLVRIHALRAQLLRSPSREPWVRHILVPAVFLLSIPIAVFLSTDAAKYLWLVPLLSGPIQRAADRRARPHMKTS